MKLLSSLNKHFRKRKRETSIFTKCTQKDFYVTYMHEQNNDLK